MRIKIHHELKGKKNTLKGEFPLSGDFKGCFVTELHSDGSDMETLMQNLIVVVADKKSGYSEVEFEDLQKVDQKEISRRVEAWLNDK